MIFFLKISLAKIFFSFHIHPASLWGIFSYGEKTMKLFAYTLVSLFAVLSFANADENKSPASNEEVILEQTEEVLPADEAKK